MKCLPTYKGKQYNSIELIKNVIKQELQREAETGIKREDQPVQKISLTFSQKANFANNIALIVMGKIGMSDTLTSTQLERLLDETFNELVEQNQENFPGEINEILGMRDEILGLRRFFNEDSSARNYIATYLGLTEKAVNEDTSEEVVGNENTSVEGSENPLDSSETEDIAGDFESSSTYGYDQSAYEIDMTKSLSKKVMMLLSGIKSQDKYGKTSVFEPFMGLDSFVQPNTVLLTLQNILANSSNDMESIKRKVKQKIDESPLFGFLEEVIERIEAQPLTVQNQILNKLNSVTNDMSFVLVKVNLNTGRIKSSVLDANSRTPELRLAREFDTNFRQISLINLEDNNQYSINITEAENVLAALEDMSNKAEVGVEDADPQAISKVLSRVGLNIHPYTIENYLNKPDSVSGVNYRDLFSVVHGPLGIVMQNLQNTIAAAKEMKGQGEKLLIPLDYTNPIEVEMDSGETLQIGHILFYNNNNFLKELIQAELKNRLPLDASNYLDGKSINGTVIPNLAKSLKNEIRQAALAYHDSPGTETEGKLRELTNQSINKNNFLLQSLIENPRAAIEFDVETISPDSFKVQSSSGEYKKNDKNGKISDLGPKDYLTVMQGFFGQMGANLVLGDEGNPKRGRIASMFFPTLSDASDLYVLKAAVMDITSEDAEVDINTNEVLLSPTILEYMADNLVYSEMNRIISYMMNVYANDDFSALNSDQNFASMFFLGLPGLNFVKEDGIMVIDAIHSKIKVFTDKMKVKNSNESKLSEEEQVEALTEEIKGFMQPVVENFMINLAKAEKEKFLKKDLETGMYTGEWVNKEIVDSSSNGLINNAIDTKYLESKAKGRSLEERLETAALDFAINSLVSQANIQNVFAGDLTNYAQDAGSFEKDADGNIDFFSLKTSLVPENTTSRENAMRTVIDKMTEKMSVNRSKRLKALLSPSLKNANSKNQQYIQLFMQDMEGISNYIEGLIDLHYPGELTQKDRDMLSETLQAQREIEEIEEGLEPDESRVKELQQLVKLGRSHIADKFPKVAGFTKITGTDAQEYTTWREHLRTIMDRGSANELYTKEEIQKIYDKLNDYEKSDYKGTLELTEKEKDIIFQPLKPLHAGTYSDSSNDKGNYKYGFVNSQFIYVKTSSFPLIPGITMGTKLDNIRKNLENLEKLHGMPVRASYASGNKVGGTKVAVSTNSLSGNILTDEQLDHISKSSTRVLDRKYFGIQQDKPYKADKNLENNKRNEISRAVQIERALLSNGIATSEEKIFDLQELNRNYLESLGIEISPQGKISGKDLFTVINDLYSEEQNLNRDILYNKFNATGQQWQNDIKTIEKLRSILLKEAETSQAKKALDLVYLVEEETEDGEIIQSEITKKELDERKLKAVSARFKVPLWLNNNSLKMESSLNAMVTKSLARLKMSGWSSPVGSSNKFTLKDEDKLTENEISDIVYLDGYDGKELKYDVDENGKLVYSQVLVSSRFDYIKEVGTNPDGTSIYKRVYADLTSNEYSEVVGNRRVLKSENFDKDLLKALSFRTPFSDLGSGAVIEIVGFLPRKMGDLMIVPREHTVQFGEDYDIDVRNAYAFNHESYKRENGTVGFRKLSLKRSSDFVKKNLKKIQEEYERERDILYGQAEDLQQTYYMLNMDRIAEIKILRERKSVLKPLVKSGEITEQDLLDELDLINTTLAELDFEVAKSQYRENVEEINQMVDRAMKDLGSNAREARTKALENITKMRTYQQYRKKMIENDILKVYHAVYGSNNKEIRKSINKSLNTDLSERTVKISKSEAAKNEAGVDKIYRTLYSSLEQQKIMESGHSGKLGIGVHSLWVTFTALAQHMKNPINISFGELNETIKFGNLSFKPTIGSKETVSNKKEGKLKNTVRFITEVNMENQNVATDNQKLLIMGDRNENEFTINAFALLCNMGVDTDVLTHPDYAIRDSSGNITGYPQVHIPSLFLNQPILKRYVELKKQNASLTNKKFMSDKDIYNKLFDELAESSSKEEIAKYKEGEIETEVNGLKISQKIELNFENLTPENLLSQSTGGEVNPVEQAQILHFFRELDIKSKEISAHQGILKIGSNGIEKSSFKNIHVKEFLKNLASGNEGSLEGITNMYGEFQNFPVDPNKTYEEQQAEIKKSLPEGFILGTNVVDDREVIQVFIPNNFAGSKLISVVQSTTDILSNIFPYENPAVLDIIRSIFEDTEYYRRAIANKDEFGALDMFSGKGLEFTYKIMAGLKNYLSTAEFSGFYAGDVQSERKRILYKERVIENGEEKTLPSLAGYLNQLRADPDFDWMFKQAFFRDIDPVLNDINTPDILKLTLNNKNPTEMQDINTFLRSLYEMTDRSLPPFKGDTEYNTKKLILDLARYSSLAGDSGGAMGFKNLIPFEVFEDSSYNEILRMFDNILTNPVNSRFDGTLSIAARGNMNALLNIIGPNTFAQAMRQSENGGRISLEDYSDATIKRIENLTKKLNKVNGKEIFSISGKTLTVVGLSDKDIIRNILKDQILRHNPDMLISVKEDTVLNNAISIEYVENKEDLGIYGASKVILDPEDLHNLNLDSETEYFKVPYSTGEALFRKVPGTTEFVRVDKLGITGSQEYTLTSKNTDSGIGANNRWRDPNEEIDRGYEVEEQFEESSIENTQGPENSSELTFEEKLASTTDLKSTVLEFLNTDAPSLVIIREMEQMGIFSDNLGPIEFLDTMTAPNGSKAGGVYIKEGKTLTLNGIRFSGPKIILNREIFNDPNIDNARKARILAEELLHKGTVNFLSEFVSTSVDENGKVQVQENFDETPKSIKELINVQQAALNSMIKTVMKDRNLTREEALELIIPLIHSFKTPLGRELSPEDKLLQMKLYRFSSLEEFVAGVITDKNFRTQMSKHTYKGQTILDNIAKILEEMFNTIAKFSGRDITITEAGVSAVYDILTDIRESEKNKTIQPQSDPDAKKIIDEAEGKNQKVFESNPHNIKDFSFFASFGATYGFKDAKKIGGTTDILRKTIQYKNTDFYTALTILDDGRKKLSIHFKHLEQNSNRGGGHAGLIFVFDANKKINNSLIEKLIPKVEEFRQDNFTKEGNHYRINTNNIKDIKPVDVREKQKLEEGNSSEDSETSIGTFNIFAEEAQEDRKFLSEKFLSELNTQPFTKAIALVLRKVTKKC